MVQGTSYELDDPRLAERVNLFPESVILEMTRVNDAHDAVNLGQGFPDEHPPEIMVEAAHEALDGPHNQYATTWGTAGLREAICEKAAWFNGIEADPDEHVTVTCGATEAMMATMLSLVDPGDEVVLFDPSAVGRDRGTLSPASDGRRQGARPTAHPEGASRDSRRHLRVRAVAQGSSAALRPAS